MPRAAPLYTQRSFAAVFSPHRSSTVTITIRQLTDNKDVMTHYQPSTAQNAEYMLYLARSLESKVMSASSAEWFTLGGVTSSRFGEKARDSRSGRCEGRAKEIFALTRHLVYPRSFAMDLRSSVRAPASPRPQLLAFIAPETCFATAPARTHPPPQRAALTLRTFPPLTLPRHLPRAGCSLQRER